MFNKEEYIQKGYSKCPICKDTDIYGDSLDIDGNSVSQECHCVACSAAWKDIYRLEDVEIIDHGDS